MCQKYIQEAEQSPDAVLYLRHPVKVLDRAFHTGIPHTLGSVPSQLAFVNLLDYLQRDSILEAFLPLDSAPGVHADFP